MAHVQAGPPGSKPPDEAEAMLLDYLEENFINDASLSAANVKLLLSSSSGPLKWDQISEDGMPLLHIAVMVEDTPPQEMWQIVTDMLACGAPPMMKDSDGDTALEAVLSLAEDASEEDELRPNALHTQVAAVCALLSSKQMLVERQQVLSIASWLRRYIPQALQRQVLDRLEVRAGKEQVSQVWCSEELLDYLETCAYTKKCGVHAQKVCDFLARGASPSHQQKGATALLMTVLNPYSQYSELVTIFRSFLKIDPSVATVRDGFRLSPLQWAADYVNVAYQHNLRRPNAAVLLALMPAICAHLPDDMDAGEACLKVSQSGSSGGPPASVKEPPPHPRFIEGDRVLCRVEVPGGRTEWEEGVVIGLWYREGCWPKDHPGAPYEVKLDLGSHYFALVDHDRIIRREVPEPPASNTEGLASAVSPGGITRFAPAQRAAEPAAGADTAKAKAKAAPRFVRRQREDGKFEMVDTVSGKARLIVDDDDSD